MIHADRNVVHDPRLPLRGKLGAVHLVTPNELLYEPGVEGVEVDDQEVVKGTPWSWSKSSELVSSAMRYPAG